MTIDTLYTVSDLNRVLAQVEKPENVYFRLTHFKNIRAKQIRLINQLQSDKQIIARRIGKSKLNLSIKVLSVETLTMAEV